MLGWILFFVGLLVVKTLLTVGVLWLVGGRKLLVRVFTIALFVVVEGFEFAIAAIRFGIAQRRLAKAQAEATETELDQQDDA